MTNRTDQDPTIAGWLAEGPSGMPADVRSSIVSATRDRPQAVARGPVRLVGARTRVTQRASWRLLIPLVALIGLGASITAGAFLLRAPDDPPGRLLSGTYTSARYGYTLAPPEGWTVQPATADWRVVDPWDAGPAADVFRSPDGLRFTVVGNAMGSPASGAIYGEAVVPDRPEWDRTAQACRVPGTAGPPGPTPMSPGRRVAWVEERVGSYDVDVRAACGYVDAVIVQGAYAYVLSLAGPPRPDGDLATFRRLAATFTALDRAADAGPSPTPIPRWTPRPTQPLAPLGPLDVAFVSTRYAYSIKHPGDWVATPATITYVPGARSITQSAVADGFDGPASARVTVTAVALEPSTDVAVWLERWAPSRYAFDTVCKFGGNLIPGSTLGWQPMTIGGHEAQVRSQCGYAEAAIRIGDRLWYVAHRSAQRIGHGEREVLDAFLATMTFDTGARIGGAEDGTEHPSTRYAYTIRVPADWTVEEATEDYVAGRSWRAGRGADQYVGPEGETFSAAAVDLPAGMALDAWLARYAPSRVQIQAGGHQHCVFRSRGGGTTTVESSATGWSESTVAGLGAWVRSDCASLDAAIIIGRRLFLLSHDRGHPAPNGDRAAFDRLAQTIWIDPDTSGSRPVP